MQMLSPFRRCRTSSASNMHTTLHPCEPSLIVIPRLHSSANASASSIVIFSFIDSPVLTRQQAASGYSFSVGGAHGRIRTCNHQLRRLVLYPFELRALTIRPAPWHSRVSVPGCPSTPRRRADGSVVWRLATSQHLSSDHVGFCWCSFAASSAAAGCRYSFVCIGWPQNGMSSVNSAGADGFGCGSRGCAGWWLVDWLAGLLPSICISLAMMSVV